MNKITELLGGMFLRPWIKKQLGKDWWASMTVWGLILHETAEGFVNLACAQGAIEVAACAALVGYLETAGKVLVVLGIRRKG